MQEFLRLPFFDSKLIFDLLKRFNEEIAVDEARGYMVMNGSAYKNSPVY